MLIKKYCCWYNEIIDFVIIYNTHKINIQHTLDTKKQYLFKIINNKF
jgi:hypothetical protein